MRPPAVLLLLILMMCTAVGIEECKGNKHGSDGQTCSNPDCQAEGQHIHSRPKFTYIKGLFVQEKKSASLQSPGQHPNFGAKRPWSEILEHLNSSRKLLFLLRHGEATSNAVQAYVGEKAWQDVTTLCSWKNESSGKTLQLFDPSLTARGLAQAAALKSLLLKGNVAYSDLTGNRSTRAVVSPLSRTLETHIAVLASLVPSSMVAVDEWCRERFGRNTCDARRPLSSTYSSENSSDGPSADAVNPHAMRASSGPAGAMKEDTPAARQLLGSRTGGTDLQRQEEEPVLNEHNIHCHTDVSLKEKYPDMQIRVTGQDTSHLGLVSNEDTWWKDDERESDKALKKRARAFLARVFAEVQEDVVFVVTHSGMIGALLKAVGRESYSATNAELVPVLVEAVR